MSNPSCFAHLHRLGPLLEPIISLDIVSGLINPYTMEVRVYPTTPVNESSRRFGRARPESQHLPLGFFCFDTLPKPDRTDVGSFDVWTSEFLTAYLAVRVLKICSNPKQSIYSTFFLCPLYRSKLLRVIVPRLESDAISRTPCTTVFQVYRGMQYLVNEQGRKG